MNLVEEAIKNWESYRAGLIAELENIPDSQMGYSPGDGGKTVREVAMHVAETGVAFLAELMKPDGNYANFFKPEVQAALKASMPTANSKAELVALLKSTGADFAAGLRAVGEPLAMQTMPTRAGTQSRLTALNFSAAHEQYHRGQLAVYARALGAIPMLTQQINAMLARQPLVS